MEPRADDDQVLADGTTRDFCLPHLLGAWAERSPDAVAFAAPGRAPLRYKALHAHLAATGQALHTLGIGRRDRVAMVLPSGPEMAAAFLAISAVAAAAPLNPGYRAEEFAAYLDRLRATALITQAGSDSPAVAVARAQGLPLIELAPLPQAEAGLFTLTGEARAPRAPLAAACPDDVALVLPTSGTTAVPKTVALTQRSLAITAQRFCRALELGPRDRCLNVMPLFHVHGLLGATLASLIAGGSVICAGGFDAEAFFSWLDEGGPTWYTAVPTIHQAVLAHAGAHRAHAGPRALRFIRSASAPLPRQVLHELESVFGAPVVETYGMTEAPIIAGNPLPPRQRKVGSVGIAVDLDLAIMSDYGDLLPVGQTGEIVIRGAGVTPADGGETPPTTQGWFRTGDQGYLDADGYLFITGRLKEIINRGGEKVSPGEVESVLLDHPAVTQAVAFALPHRTLGDEVGAAVVLRDQATATEHDLQAFATRHLAAFKVPGRIVVVADVPKGPTGKIQRIGLAERLGIGAPGTGTGHDDAVTHRSFVAPQTPTEVALAEMWSKLLKQPRVGVFDSFVDLGGDSLLATVLYAQVLMTHGIDLSEEVLSEKAATVAGMAALIDELRRV